MRGGEYDSIDRAFDHVVSDPRRQLHEVPCVVNGESCGLECHSAVRGDGHQPDAWRRGGAAERVDLHGVADGIIIVVAQVPGTASGGGRVVGRSADLHVNLVGDGGGLKRCASPRR